MKIPTESEKVDEKKESSSETSKVQDFAEYMWMENEEEFDKEVMKQLEEEALMEQCIEAMLEDELENKPGYVESSDFLYDFQRMCVQEKAELAKKSTLNPNAAEFIPRVAAETSS
ncbi:polyadenylate-binding protein-interacting protein 2 [Cimex lectularius]|uniref:Ataxin-2 C-terminal domain-containing protein n=1 Tax=Cimex lectularius TaxID=79782 RepID=A0A8I6RIX1_CIMLE|nr:polyadenylate-binding protein-interacting protein 2 [Cimex lectularius]